MYSNHDDSLCIRIYSDTQLYKNNQYSVGFFLPMLISSAESQKGAIADQRCSVENQKGAIATDFVQRSRPSGSQRNIFELQ